MSANTRGQAAYEAFCNHANIAWVRPYGQRYERWANLTAADVTAWDAFAVQTPEGSTAADVVQAAYEALAGVYAWIKNPFGDRWARFVDVSAAHVVAYTAAATAAIAADVSDDPVVTSISPTSGTHLGGTPVTIVGSGFTGATDVKIGGVSITALVVTNDTHIAGTTAAKAAGTYDVVVTTPNGSGPLAAAYTFT